MACVRPGFTVTLSLSLPNQTKLKEGGTHPHLHPHLSQPNCRGAEQPYSLPNRHIRIGLLTMQALIGSHAAQLVVLGRPACRWLASITAASDVEKAIAQKLSDGFKGASR